ncbi:PRC-barrel domain-containing protein [Bacillus sp. PS06]|uniref:PRC-barrel domain-containing protein n=1 Tax=Bacillus sp. PS06 TaxID=2764176 RepID=UPI00177F4D26|nr:PRC-barrel domain-containing protein [Bacillus sp. PS06]MBD8069257.1 PRC-barrel domain-containing protein [Bacillus sp. PS06]
MRTFSLLKGLPIYQTDKGKLIGHVSDICLSEEGTVEGILIDGKGLFQRDRLIPVESISSFGHDGVMIDSCVELKPIPKDQSKHFLYSHHGLYRKPVITEEGEKLGLLEDVYFQEEVGTIIGYELTDGFFADIAEGKKVIKTKTPLTIGEEVLVVQVKP